MKKETSKHGGKSGGIYAAAHEYGNEGLAKAESLLPSGSWQRVAAGVAAAAGGSLVVAAMVGVGPAALAGAAGYLAYRGMGGRKKKDQAGFAGHKH